MAQPIELKHLRKTFTDGTPLTVFEDLNLVIPREGITVVLGKSGCGKTTLLRLVSGLDRDYEGTIVYPDGAKTAIVFQEPRLMPWLTVEKNITFGLKKREVDRDKVASLLELTGLAGFERALPAQLSGGMEQRTAIARALATEPDFLLMDEPFAALDYFTRSGMQKSLLAIQKEDACGVLFITHSIDEAMILGDHIVILRDRKVEKEYHLEKKDVPADLASPEMLALKEDILGHINENNEKEQPT